MKLLKASKSRAKCRVREQGVGVEMTRTAGSVFVEIELSGEVLKCLEIRENRRITEN